MADITIRVRNRIAEAVGSPEIICGNSDYNAIFDLDAEWDAQEIKTMRVAWTDTFSGQPRHIDVPFFMGFAAIPAIADAYEVQIGVYTGNIMTTTPARIPCVRCITDGGTYHEDPEPETYAALLQLLGDITQGGVTVGDATVVLGGVNIGTVGIITESPFDTVTVDMTDESWEQGSGTPSTGEMDNQRTDRLRCKTFFAIPEGAFEFTVEADGTSSQRFDYDVYFYTDSDFIYPEIGWTAYGVKAAFPYGATRYRVLLRKSNNATITPVELMSCTMTYYK